MGFGGVVLRLRHCPAGRGGRGRTGGGALCTMRSFSRLVRMLASRRQLCSSRHNVREREVVARRQACVGDRGFVKGLRAGRDSSVRDDSLIWNSSSRRSTCWCWCGVCVDVDGLSDRGGEGRRRCARVRSSHSLGGGAERWSGAGQQRDIRGDIAVGCT